MPDKEKRIAFHVSEEFYEEISREIPWGFKAPLLRQLLKKSIDAAKERGVLVYGAIIGGDFTIEYKEKDSEPR